MDFLIQNNINVLPWPSKSPDLNPIEHLLDEPDRCFRQCQPHLNNWTNSVKHCNMNGKGYHRSEYIMYSLHAKEMQNSVSRKWWSQYILILTSPEIDPIYSIWLVFVKSLFIILQDIRVWKCSSIYQCIAIKNRFEEHNKILKNSLCFFLFVVCRLCFFFGSHSLHPRWSQLLNIYIHLTIASYCYFILYQTELKFELHDKSWMTTNNSTYIVRISFSWL
jgi:hypothetical protein